MLNGYLLTVVGLLCFVEGLPYVAFPASVKRWLLKLCSIPDGPLRVLGGVLMVLGLLLVYLGRSHGG